MLSYHAIERLARSGRFTLEEAEAVARVADRFARYWADRDAAIRIARCKPRETGLDETGEAASNGDEVWAIAREGTVVTIMLRRSTQPDTCEAFAGLRGTPVDTVAHGKRAVRGRA